VVTSEQQKSLKLLFFFVAVTESRGSVIHMETDITAKEAPVWIPDSAAPICMMCGDYFTIVKRRVSLFLFLFPFFSVGITEHYPSLLPFFFLLWDC
jgi:hypothetical protein